MRPRFWFFLAVIAPCFSTWVGADIPTLGNGLSVADSDERYASWDVSLMSRVEPKMELDAWIYRRNAETPITLKIRDAYSQSHTLALSMLRFHNQSFSVQLPFQYTYLIAGGEGYADAVTLGDMRMLWQSHVLQTGPISWHTLAGVILPTATRGEGADWAYGITDLEALPRNRQVGSGQSLAGGQGGRAIAGLRTESALTLGILPPAPWALQINLRQPINPGPRTPFTLIDVHSDMLMPLSEVIFLHLAAGQTRAWLPLPLIDPVAPSASFLQAAFALRWGQGFLFSLGVRGNPLSAQEKEPYTVRHSENETVRVQVAAEPPWQIRVGIAYRGLGRQQAESQSPAIPAREVSRKAHRQNLGNGDRDQDGVSDVQDRCPDIREDLDGYRDQDGCPDADNDRDGIADAADLCPNDAEDRDGHHDADGCPDLDNDGDGIPDIQDRCPSARETMNFYQDGDGCPDEKPDRVSRNDLQGLLFAHGKADLDARADSLIAVLAHKLAIYKGTQVILYGHAEPTESNGKALGLLRAGAVAEALKKLGIASDRISLVSMAASEPVSNNQSAKGRAQNRRVTLEPR
jgi:outer membrane protein OmpA-like peptidoglycan-associated protein